MKLKAIIISLSLATTLVACGSGSSGGGSSNNTTPPNSDTYSNNDVVINTSSVGAIQAIGTTGSTSGAYLATPNGVYSVAPSTTQSRSLEKGSTLTPVNTTPGVFQISGSGSNLYYSTSSNIYSYNNGTQTTITLPSGVTGNLTALSQASSNGTLYYGTSTGYVGALNNPANKQINPIVGQGGVLAIGCIANGACNSGQQGIITLTLTSGNIGGLLPFESSNTAAQWNYPTAFSYYDLGTWITPSYNATLGSNITKDYYTSNNNPGIQGSNATVASSTSVNEFVTAVTFNGGNIYVGTNLFNIYAATNYTCNHGQSKQAGGCAVNFTGPINKVPLGWLQTSVDSNPNDGSVGISYIAVQSSGQLLAVAQESATYASVYTSQATSY
jgi:hypothetical protein